MKYFLAISYLSFFLILTLKAQTNVSGGIYNDATWTLSNSPYIVIDTVVVFPHVTLTIEPGVEVRFEDNKRLEVRQATLIAAGTNEDSIIFTSNSATPYPGIWGEIFLNGGTVSDMFEFSHCRFSYANMGFHLGGPISSQNFINNCSFTNNLTGISSCCNTTTIDSCIFLGNAIGISSLGYTRLRHSLFMFNDKGVENCAADTFENCTFRFNHYGLHGVGLHVGINNCIISNNQIGFENEIQGQNYTTIQNSFIDSNSIAGIDFTIGATITNCHISYNQTGIIDSIQSSIFGISTINNNVIENNVTGIKLNSSRHNILCNKICNNSSYNLYYNVLFGSTSVLTF
ncbi:hypothetical protein BH11BAC1_BH11BAC1_26140 [soil metagenome]